MEEGGQTINPEYLSKSKQVVLATTTFYPSWTTDNNSVNTSSDQIRGDLAIQMVSKASELGYRVIIVDGGSNQEFTQKVISLGGEVFDQDKTGMGNSRRQSLSIAAEQEHCKIICWVEPEKVSLIKDIHNLIVPIEDGEADIVIPTRTQKSFLTYPDYQARHEQRGNKLWNSILKSRGIIDENQEDFDVWFGPRIFKNDKGLLDIFQRNYAFKPMKTLDDINSDDWANSIFLPIIEALRQGYKVKGVLTDYEHPAEQTQYENESSFFKRKRLHQLRSIITATIEYIRINESIKQSKLVLNNE